MLNFKNITQKIAATCAISVICLGCTETTSDNTVAGLKEALTIGVGTAVTSLSTPGGYLNDQAVKILLPEEAQNTFTSISKIQNSPLGATILANIGIPDAFENTIVTLINSAAEDAAPQAKDVFVGAITGMTVTDGQSILFGANNAATSYLESKTYTGLQAAFEPSITKSLTSEEITVAGYNPMSAWNKLAETNNTIADKVNGNLLTKMAVQALGVSINPMETNLSNYVTGKALDGLFTKVADQETLIRTDINSRTTDLLRDVFGRLDK